MSKDIVMTTAFPLSSVTKVIFMPNFKKEAIKKQFVVTGNLHSRYEGRCEEEPYLRVRGYYKMSHIPLSDATTYSFYFDEKCKDGLIKACMVVTKGQFITCLTDTNELTDNVIDEKGDGFMIDKKLKTPFKECK